MREILFKAKRIDNGEWVEGCYAECNGKTFIGIDISIGIDDIFEVFCTHVIRWLEVDPETLCQFTGGRLTRTVRGSGRAMLFGLFMMGKNIFIR